MTTPFVDKFIDEDTCTLQDMNFLYSCLKRARADLIESGEIGRTQPLGLSDGCPYSRLSRSSDVQVAYFKMRILGQSHRMAEMLATRSFPGIRGTDSTFMSGSHMQDGLLDGVRQRMAAQAGVDTNGRRYIAGLARFPGDPEAWVSGLSDVKRICSDRGWNCHGAFEYEAPEPWSPPAPDVPVAEDIVQERVSAELAVYDRREITPRLVEEVTDKATQLLSGAVDSGQDLQVDDYSYDEALALSEPE